MPQFLLRSAMAANPSVHDETRTMPGRPEDRILVVVQLSGGNDGLNTMIPYQNDVYYRSRPGIAIPQNDVLRFSKNSDVGLHPEMRSLQNMLDKGLAGVVLGAGYPNPNRSHFVSMDIWHTGDTAGGRGHGWLGKALDQRQEKAGKTDSTACVCIGKEMPLATNGKMTRAVTFEDPNLFRWSGSDLHDVLDQEYDKANRAGVLPGFSTAEASEAAFLQRTALDAQVASDRIRAAVARDSVTQFPGGALSNELKMVSSMIRAELPTRVYYVGMGGFDTHANQGFAHGRNLQNFSRSIESFYAELSAAGIADRVLTVGFSEFGRRVAQNASNGTDHGTAGPMFLFGPMVKNEILGTYPNLDQLDNNGDMIHTVDFRSIYASILEQWMKLDSTAILGNRYRQASIFNRMTA